MRQAQNLAAPPGADTDQDEPQDSPGKNCLHSARENPGSRRSI